MNNYVAEFYYNTLDKRGKIAREYGEVDITTDVPYNELPTNQDFLDLIAEEMADVSGKAVLSITIKKIYPV